MMQGHWLRTTPLAVLSLHVMMVAWVGFRTSPTLDEVAHLPAGVSYWQFGRFDIYNVNPPLTRLIAAAPVVLCRPRTDWHSLITHVGSRPEWTIGQDFIEANGERALFYFRLARWACIPFSVLGAWVCWQWSRKLYGESSGLLALTLWCFCPNILAWAATITPDVGATATGVLAAYCFWKWLQRSGWPEAFAAGLALGVAELTKMTWIVLFALWPSFWVICRAGARRSRERGSWKVEAMQLTAILLLALYVLHLGYGFEDSGRRLGDFKFASRMLGGVQSPSEYPEARNRFADTRLACVPVPLPRNYLQGIDLQRFDFERGNWSYLNGVWKYGGWWYYYLYALTLKVPLGTWILALLAVAVTLAKRLHYWAGWRGEFVLLALPLAVFVLVSSQTGFGRYLRYVLPCFPFAFIWISKVGRCIELKHWGMSIVGALALLWSVTSSLSVYPHSMAYFNELAGGPEGGHRYLLDANIDWGQDLIYLKEWYDAHPEARPLHLACHTFFSPKVIGIEYDPVPPGPRVAADRRIDFEESTGPQPGWYAISIHMLREREGRYAYFLEHFRPTAMAGYSIYIYQITMQDANRVRRKMGLPLLEPGAEEADAGLAAGSDAENAEQPSEGRLYLMQLRVRRLEANAEFPGSDFAEQVLHPLSVESAFAISGFFECHQVGSHLLPGVPGTGPLGSMLRVSDLLRRESDRFNVPY